MVWPSSDGQFLLLRGPQVLWFKLLDAVVIPLRRLKSQRNRMKVAKPNFNAAAGGPGQKMDGTTASGSLRGVTYSLGNVPRYLRCVWMVCDAVRCAL